MKETEKRIVMLKILYLYTLSIGNMQELSMFGHHILPHVCGNVYMLMFTCHSLKIFRQILTEIQSVK